MFIISLLIILTICFSTLFTCIASVWNILSFGFIPLWIVLGLISTLLLMGIELVLLIYVIMPLGKPGSKLIQKLVHPWIKFVNIVAKMHISVEGKENIPNETFVIYSNHKSMLDITILYDAINRPISAMAKSELSTVPVLKTLAKSLRVQYINRSNDREAVKNLLVAIKYVEGGLNYFIFPEGGIKTRDTELMVDVKPGAYKLATKPQAVILPTTIIGSSKLTTNAFKKRTDIKVIFHKPIYPDEYNQYNTHEIGEKVEQIVNEGVLNEQKA